MSYAGRFFLIPLLFISAIGFPQKEGNQWHFGHHTGLDFNPGTPTVITQSSMFADEGGASIADENGKLLFYTNGNQVWNRDHKQMPNGFLLLGSVSSSQCLIVPKPDSKDTYYIFTAAPDSHTAGVRYSEVDMSKDNGLGDVVVKNVLLHSPSCEKVAGVLHCNKTDVWVMTHDYKSDQFRAFLVTSQGVNMNPVISKCGLYVEGTWGDAANGQLKFSPAGNKLAAAYYGNKNTQKCMNKFEVYDFDRSTGIVSNALTLPQIQNDQGAYGVEFSPDGSKLYCSVWWPGKIFQFNMKAGSLQAILSSSVMIGEGGILAMQQGPDKKIYVSNGTYRGIIHAPNAKGQACKYDREGIKLPKFGSGSLPSFISSWFRQPPPLFTYTVNCLRSGFTAPETMEDVTFVHWDFGDSLAQDNISSELNPYHIYSKPGSYKVMLVLNYSCGSDTLRETIPVSEPDTALTVLKGEDAVCIGKSAVLSPTVTGTYQWNTGDSGRILMVTPVIPTNYEVLVRTNIGCMYRGNKTVSIIPLPMVTIREETIAGSSRLYVSPAGSYTWEPSTGLSCSNCAEPIAEPGESTLYCVMVSDENNCVSNACIDLRVNPVFIPNTFTPNGDGLNDMFLPFVSETKSFRLIVYDHWGVPVFESDRPDVGWNGKYNGLNGKHSNELCPSGVYVYELTYKDRHSNKLIEKSGLVTLMH